MYMAPLILAILFRNMVVFGLAKATEHVRAVGGRETASGAPKKIL